MADVSRMTDYQQRLAPAVAAALATGMTRQQAADAVGTSKETVKRIARRPEFRAEVERQQSERMAAITAKITDALPDLLDRVTNTAKPDSTSVRLLDVLLRAQYERFDLSVLIARLSAAEAAAEDSTDEENVS